MYVRLTTWGEWIALVLGPALIAGCWVGYFVWRYTQRAGRREGSIMTGPAYRRYALFAIVSALLVVGAVITFDWGKSHGVLDLFTSPRAEKKPVLPFAAYAPAYESSVMMLPPRATCAPVRVNGAWTSLHTTATFGVERADSVRTFFPHLHTNRIRRDGAVTRVRLYAALGTANSAYKAIRVQFWRRTAGQRLSLVGETGNIIRETGGVIDAALDTPVEVKRGDYPAVMATKPAGVAGGNLFAAPPAQHAALRHAGNAAPPSRSFTWYAQPGLGAFNLEIECYMDEPPQVVAIGYSLVEGHGLQHGYAHDVDAATDTTSATDPAVATAGWDAVLFGDLRPGVSWENAGIGGQTAAEIMARASRDCFQLNPRVAIVQMGGNDTDSSLVYTHMSAFLDSCAARDIMPVVLGLTPMTAKSNARMFCYDRMNVALENLCNMRGALFVHLNAALGQPAVGGSPSPPLGNLWDIQDAYNADGLHYTPQGQVAFATAISRHLGFYRVAP